MVQFYSIDSDDEETNQQHADHPDGMALVVDREHHSTGIRMTPKVCRSNDPPCQAVYFSVIEEGEYDGETGYWVAEEETGDEGFVSLYIEDEFWVLSAKGGYNKRRVFSRRFKQGKGKGKGGQRKRPGFRPRSQKKGKGYLADEVPDDQAFYGKKGKKGGKKGGKKQKDSFKSSKTGKTSKGDSSSSSGKANIAASSPSEEHVDAMEATAAGQDAWSEDYYWDSNYGCWVYFEQWDNQHESWNYFVHDGWDVRTGLQCNGVSTDFQSLA